MSSWWVKNLVGPPSPLALPSNYVAGNAFFCEVDGLVLKIGARKMAAGDTLSGLAIWRLSDVSQVYRVTTGLPTSGAADWLEYTLPDPLAIEAGEEYRVTAKWTGAINCAIWSYGTLPAHPDGTLSKLAGGVGCAAPGSIDTWPASLDSGNVYNTDLHVQQTGVPNEGEPPTNTDVENALARWFSANSDNTRQAHLPWLTHALATAINGAVDETKDMVEALVAIGIGVKLGDAQTALDGLEAFLYSVAPDSLKSYLDGLETDIRGSGNPTIADTITAINNIPTGGGGLPAGPVSVANGWTMRETVSGVGKIKWDEPADAYILVRTGWDSDREVNVYEGVTYFFDRGWWAPQQADVIEGYGTLAAATHLLRVPTGRMSGVLIVQDDDFEFDLQAWDAPGAP